MNLEQSLLVRIHPLRWSVFHIDYPCAKFEYERMPAQRVTSWRDDDKKDTVTMMTIIRSKFF